MERRCDVCSDTIDLDHGGMPVFVGRFTSWRVAVYPNADGAIYSTCERCYKCMVRAITDEANRIATNDFLKIQEHVAGELQKQRKDKEDQIARLESELAKLKESL